MYLAARTLTIQRTVQALNNYQRLHAVTRLCPEHLCNTLQSQIQDFPKEGALSCEVPSRRDSVGGGGVVAEFFRGLRKPARFSGGG